MSTVSFLPSAAGNCLDAFLAPPVNPAKIDVRSLTAGGIATQPGG
jgi:hypothetical protein